MTEVFFRLAEVISHYSKVTKGSWLSLENLVLCNISIAIEFHVFNVFYRELRNDSDITRSNIRFYDIIASHSRYLKYFQDIKYPVQIITFLFREHVLTQTVVFTFIGSKKTQGTFGT